MASHKKSLRLTGLSVSPGLAQGKAYIYHDIFEQDAEIHPIERHQIDDECARTKIAVEQVLADLVVTAKRVEQELDEDLAEIFYSHVEMLRDSVFTSEIKIEIEKKLINAEYAVQSVFRKWENKFLAMKDAVHQHRASDVADLGRRILRALIGVRGHSLEKMPEGHVLVARRLMPSETVFLSRRNTVAAVVEIGGIGSHCALLTREMGIPAVVQIPDLLKMIAMGDLLLVDGLQGSVIVKPDHATFVRFNKDIQRHAAAVSKTKIHRLEPARTLDGVEIPVMANIGCKEDTDSAVENGADGIGLYRIETFYLAHNTLPTEQELFEELSKNLEPFKGKFVCVRLLDVGGDKFLAFLRLPSEPNPNLGRRGIRLLLDYPEILQMQLRVLLMLTQDYDLHILVPMITLAEDIQRVKRMLSDVASSIGIQHLPPLGAMIETPAAALCVEEIMKHADFLSIGSNDLTQYVMAADRENSLVNRYYQETHPSILRLIEFIFQKPIDKPVALCGELAANSDAISGLLRSGIRLLSVAPPFIPMVKEKVRSTRAFPH